jgi:hypothetical protein
LHCNGYGLSPFLRATLTSLTNQLFSCVSDQIWNQLAHGDGDYCAILVIINSVLQIVLFAPMSVFFVNVIGGETTLKLQYGHTAIAVLIVRSCLAGFSCVEKQLNSFSVVFPVPRYPSRSRHHNPSCDATSPRTGTLPDPLPPLLCPMVSHRPSLCHHHHLC